MSAQINKTTKTHLKSKLLNKIKPDENKDEL